MATPKTDAQKREEARARQAARAGEKPSGNGTGNVSDALSLPKVVGEIDGRTLLFSKLTFRDRIIVEREYGSFDDFTAALAEEKQMPLYLLLGIQLKKTFPDLSLDDVFDWLGDHEVTGEEQARLINEAIMAAFPKIAGLMEASESDDPNPEAGEDTPEASE